MSVFGRVLVGVIDGVQQSAMTSSGIRNHFRDQILFAKTRGILFSGEGTINPP